MSVTSESSLPPMQMASSNDGSLPASAHQLGAPSSGRSGLLGDLSAVDRSRASPISPHGQPINPKLTTHRDPNRQSTVTRDAAGSSNGVVMEISKSPQDVVVQQLTSREWETSELAGPREHFPTDAAALNAPVTSGGHPQRTAPSTGVQRGSTRPAKVAAARSPGRASASRPSPGRSSASRAAPVQEAEAETLVPGQRPHRASLYHDVGPTPRTPRGGAAGSETSSVAAARRTRSASAGQYKHVRSVVRDYMDNRLTEDEARYSALRARSPQASQPRRRSDASPTPRALTGAAAAATPTRDVSLGNDVEVSPDSEAARGEQPFDAAPPTRSRTPRGTTTAAQRRSLLPPDQRAATPHSQARKVGRDFVPRCATMIPERLKYHPKPIVATEECDPTTVDGIPYDEYCAAQARQQTQQAARDAQLSRGNEASFFAPSGASYSSRATSTHQSGQRQPSSRAASRTASRQRGRRPDSADPQRRSRRTDPQQIADDEFMVPVTVDSEALSREDPYAAPRYRAASARRGRSPRAGSRGASRSRTPRAQARGVSPRGTPRGSAIAGSRASQASFQGVNPYAYRRKLVFPIAPPELSQSSAVVPVA